jgi:hypothetical protein
MLIPTKAFRLRSSSRLIPSRYPPVGILDEIASPQDLRAIWDLESWTNDRISSNFGILPRIPESEWVTGRSGSTVIMAAFCHPKPAGARFSGPDRGAWYAAKELDAAHAEVIYYRVQYFREIGVTDAKAQTRLYLADFDTKMHFLSDRNPEHRAYLDPNSHENGQRLGRELFLQGSNGIVYPSARKPGATCIACFRPPLVRNVRQSKHFEYEWHGSLENLPTIRQLGSNSP